MEQVLGCMPYNLVLDCPAPWPDQSVSSFRVASIYPFFGTLSDCSPSDFVLRVYYETLWLPEEIHPVSKLIPTLRRVQTRPATCAALEDHPLRSMLSPLLLSAHDIATKYRVEIPKFLESVWEDEIGVEESLIGFASSYERRREGEDDVTWAKRWLRRMERRE